MPNSFLLRENPTMSDHLWSTASRSVTSHHYVKNVIQYPHQGNFLSIVCNFCPLTWQFEKLLMKSDEFLPRDAMRKRGLCCDPVCICLSVHPSITFVHSIQMAEDVIKLLCRPASPILVIWSLVLIPNSKENPFSGGTKYKGVGKFCDFRLKSLSIPEMVWDRPIVTIERQ